LNIKFNILKSALIISALFLLKSFAYSQDDVLELLPGSDWLEFDNKTGVHKLSGNVNFKYQGNVMFCDSALYFEKRKVVRAYGHVHINKKDTLNLFCDSLYYNGRTRKATLWGNVRARDNEFKLTTDTLHYNAKNSQAFYRNGGKVQSIKSNEVLTSKVGYFHPESKNFFFSKDVVYKSPEMSMTTDTLRYLYSQKKRIFMDQQISMYKDQIYTANLDGTTLEPKKVHYNRMRQSQETRVTFLVTHFFTSLHKASI